MQGPFVGAIFWLPLILSVIGTGFLLHYTDLDGKWKILALVLTGTSLVLQLMHKTVHFLIPLVLQVIVSLWVVFYWKLSR